MAELLLKEYGRCVKCLKVGQTTCDHIIPREIGKKFEVLAPLVNNRRNIAPLHWRPCHIEDAEKYKQKQFQAKGIVGLIDYIGNRYPHPTQCGRDRALKKLRSFEPGMFEAFQGQMEFLLFNIAKNISELSGNVPEQYEIAYVKAEEYSRRFRNGII